ncbi:hypothetical protein VP395_10720 [Mariniflexile soesokkakense]|uniref:Uncharacterized protein n=2 Tax=Mariniflexile soesokkakense TaxID=1343160 RepID=A0ABV0AAR7_9FLAO
MKTILCIALFMMTTITFAQETNKNNINQAPKTADVLKGDESKKVEAHYVKLGDIKGESTAESNKSKEVKSNDSKEAKAIYVKLGDIKGESKPSSTTRKRVEVLKSNKQGDPDKK